MKYKKCLSFILASSMMASSVAVKAEVKAEGESIALAEDFVLSDSAVALDEDENGVVYLYQTDENLFGSNGVYIGEGEYEIPVSLMKSTDITSASMAGSCIKGGTLIVGADGKASVKIDLQPVSIFGVSDWASDWKIYKDSSKSEVIEPEYTKNSDGNIDSITFELPDKTADGVYVNMFINAMGATQDAYISLDFSALGESAEMVYEGTTHIDNFGYDVVVKVSVKDGIITNVDITGENFTYTNSNYSKSMLALATDGLKDFFVGKSSSNAEEIYNVDAVSSATVSSYAIRDAVMNALNLKIGDDITENPSVTIVNDGNYTADISILKADSDDTSSAQRSFATTEVPVRVENGKMYVQLAYTSTMIEKIEQLFGESYIELTKTATESGNYVEVELDYIEDIANIQFTINTGTAYGKMVNQARVKINQDTLKAVENKTIVADGNYTADISILKADSDDTSSAQRSFATTEVPVRVENGKMYVQLAYTSSMIEKIEQLFGENYAELAKTATESGNYVEVELDYIEDIANIQFTINTGTAYGKMVNQARVKINQDTLKAVENKTIIADGKYTADISILKADSDDTSSAQRSFTTTEVPVRVENGKMYVQLAYTSSMIEKIEQLFGENHVELTKTATENGNYVEVELDYIEDIANIQFTINTGTAYGKMVNQARVKINENTLKEVETADNEEITYSVPVKMVQAANPSLASMGSGAVDGNAIVTVKNGKSSVLLNFKAVELVGLYGHLVRLWTYPVTDTMDYSWWNNDEYETLADVTETYSDYGLNYTTGDTTKSEFAKTFRINRDAEKENSIYIRISVDAMAGFDQAARLDFDWENATVVDNIVDDVKLNSPVVTAAKNTANNGEEVEISITADNENAKIYYTTDGTMPTVNSEEYKGSFKISESNKTVVVNAVAISGDVKSEIGTTQVKFANSSTSSDSSDKIEDGKYWMTVNLWNANTDQESMGDSAFDNNRQALVTVSGNTATVEIATNPVSVSGYTSAVKDIISNDVIISIDGTSKFTTNTRYDGTEHKFDYITKFSFELDELKKEYIDVEINVPYTPMDGIVAGANSYIPARLKLNWSSLEEAGANDKLTADTSVATGTTSSGGGGGVTSSVNKETGIKVEAEAYVLPDDVEFETKTLTAGTTYSTAKNLIDGDFVLYSIKAKSETEGGEVSPVGVADVYIPVNNDDANVKIYRVVEGDKNTKPGLTEMEYKLSADGKYYVITVKEFGVFAVVNGEAAEVAETVEAFEQEKVVTADGKEISFDDISEHWAKDYILKSAEMGLFSGVEENKFAPNTNTTRAMFVTVLGRLANAEIGENANVSFDDVKETDYFFNYVQWAVENGVVSGISENSFAPNANITREQTAVILYNFAKNQGVELKKGYSANFADSENISSWAEVGVSALAEAGIISGRSDGTFDPKGTATRAEIATMLVKFVDEYMTSEAVEDTETTEETETAVEEIETTEDMETAVEEIETTEETETVAEDNEVTKEI